MMTGTTVVLQSNGERPSGIPWKRRLELADWNSCYYRLILGRRRRRRRSIYLLNEGFNLLTETADIIG